MVPFRSSPWSQSLRQRRHHRSEQVAGFSAFDMQIAYRGSLQQRFAAGAVFSDRVEPAASARRSNLCRTEAGGH